MDIDREFVSNSIMTLENETYFYEFPKPVRIKLITGQFGSVLTNTFVKLEIKMWFPEFKSKTTVKILLREDLISSSPQTNKSICLFAVTPPLVVPMIITLSMKLVDVDTANSFLMLSCFRRALLVYSVALSD